MDDKTLALLGDREAAERLTAAGVLLPCPKCKGDDLTITGDGYNVYDKDTLGYLDSVPDTVCYIVCEDCGIVSGPVEVKENEDYEDAVDRLRLDWNTRAPVLTPAQLALLKIGAEPRKFEE